MSDSNNRSINAATTNETAESASHTLNEASITEFAQQFDPQPYHLDKTAGLNSIFGDLCASGWQVAALGTRLIGEALTSNGYAFVALTSVESMRWKRPTFVDESLIAQIVIKARHALCAVPDCETLVVEATIVNDTNKVVAVMRCKAAVDTRVNA